MAHLFAPVKFKEFVKLSVRYKHGPNHWSVLKKKKTPKDRALKHFDDIYATIYENSWPNIREALLNVETRYAAVVNNFSDTQRIMSSLESCGAINISQLYTICRESKSKFSKKKKRIDDNKSIEEVVQELPNEDVSTLLSNVSVAKAVAYDDNVQELETEFTAFRNDKSGALALEEAQSKSIDVDINDTTIDESRIIDSPLTALKLHEYIPATEIMGKEDWVSESEYYKNYGTECEYSVSVQKEDVIVFPEHLKVYTFEEDAKFPPPTKGSTNVLDYFLFDAGSILPVLALDLQPGDAVLDMCAAPGGKALAIIQTLMPRLMVVNDVSRSRVNRIHAVLTEYLADVGQWKHERLFVTQEDARSIQDADIYNKILVDVPCTTDRHVLHSDENNLFKPTRLKERLQIPQIQSEILTNALKLISIGGTVVYSTCSLSPMENDGVVHVALKKAWEETKSTMVVKDMTEALNPLTCLYKFGTFGLKYGHIVIPSLRSNCGPMYFCKIMRVS